MMPDSTLEILGRIDTQIKLRGVRIESEGISAIVRSAVPQSESLSLDVTTILAKHPVINIEQLVSVFSWDKAISISTRKAKRPEIVDPPLGMIKTIKAKRRQSKCITYFIRSRSVYVPPEEVAFYGLGR